MEYWTVITLWATVLTASSNCRRVYTRKAYRTSGSTGCYPSSMFAGPSSSGSTGRTQAGVAGASGARTDGEQGAP